MIHDMRVGYFGIIKLFLDISYWPDICAGTFDLTFESLLEQRTQTRACVAMSSVMSCVTDCNVFSNVFVKK